MKYSKFTSFSSSLKYTIISLLVCVFLSCGSGKSTDIQVNKQVDKATLVDLTKPLSDSIPTKKIQTAADQLDQWLPKLAGKRVALVGNQTSVVTNAKGGFTHLVDTLISRGVNLVRVFAPEHGFRGMADAGATIKDGVDQQTGVTVISLYGKNKKPQSKHLQDVDLILFDIQDVGARFYTYISSLHYVMQSCAENKKKLLLLDRPNPNGHYIDGPILEETHQSFVGMHPVPVVHGMTIGEYAQMINGENWIKTDQACSLEVIKIKNYTHQTAYALPIPPSPNLPNDQSIALYPHLCFFEGTAISVGRGTAHQFQVFGAPFYRGKWDYSFTPKPNLGAKYPKHQGEICYGKDLTKVEAAAHLDLSYLKEAFTKRPTSKKFFNPFFTKLAGTKKLEQQLKAGVTLDKIYKSWQQPLEAYHKMRTKYLIYPL